MHPTIEELRGFVLGTLPEVAATTIGGHLSECRQCETVVEQLEKESDAVVASLRGNAQEDKYGGEPGFYNLLERVESLVPGSAPTQGPPVSGSEASPSTPALTLGRIREYELVAKLGHGGMGVVYRAIHTRLEKVVAIKKLHAERTDDSRAVARFEREMKAVGKLEHSNLVRALDAGDDAGTPYLVMEYVDGIDVDRLVHDSGPLPIADACEIVRQTAVGLQYAHTHGLVHRDIKPSNLMLTSSPHDPLVKILDLGLALIGGQAEVARDLTMDGQVMGSLDYMAPEQCDNSHSVDIRADIYSLGCTLYKLLTGEAPYSGPAYTSRMQKMVAHMTRPIPPIRELRPEVPTELAALLDRMLAKVPSQRFATPDEVATAITPFAAGNNLGRLVSLANRSQPAPATAGTSATPLKNPDAASIPTDAYLRSAMTGTEVDPIDAVGPVSESRAVAGLPTEPSLRPKVSSFDSHAGAMTKPARAKRWIPRAVVIAIAAPLFLLAGVILVVYTSRGTIEVSTPDGKLPDDLAVVLSGVGHELTVSSKDNWTIKAGHGEYEISLRGGGDQFEVKGSRVTVRRLGREVVTILRKDAAKTSTNSEQPGSPPKLAHENYALEFDGETAFIEIPSLKFAEGEPFTLDVVLVPRYQESSGVVFTQHEKSLFVLWCRRPKGAGTPDAEMSWNCFRLTDNRTNERVHFAGSEPDLLQFGKRVHVAATWDRVQIRLYVDGRACRSELIKLRLLPGSPRLPRWRRQATGQVAGAALRAEISRVRPAGVRRPVGDYRA